MESNYFQIIFHAKLVMRTKADVMHHINQTGTVRTGKGRMTMPDRENVIKGLEICVNRAPGEYDCAKCPYESYGNDCEIRLTKDALVMLKEQEPIKPTINEYGEAYCVCGENVGIIPSSKNLPSIRSKYCPECGRRMEWKYD